jgi:hypothetical protein
MILPIIHERCLWIVRIILSERMRECVENEPYFI